MCSCLGLGGKVRYHDHLLDKKHLRKGKGNFRGSAHYKCNLNYRQYRFIIPVLAHNAYFQIIIEEISKHPFPIHNDKKTIVPQLIPTAKQRMIT